MAWRDFFRPRRNVRTDGIFTKCEGCLATVRHKDINENFGVCPQCGYHTRIGAAMRVEVTVDEGSFEPLFENILPADPLKFSARKAYADRLKQCQEATKLTEALLVGKATIDKRPVVFAASDCNFMMGSMGSVLGERFTRAAELAIKEKIPFVIISGSGGGARMDEGAISLMQMAKTSAAVRRMRRAGVPYIVVVTNPTYGGVSASFASLGDVIIAEPRAQMGFTGPRVIRQTMKVELPPGFQESEFLRDHGHLDVVVERKQIAPTLVKIIDFLCPHCKPKDTVEVADNSGDVSSKDK